jgi:hypothetical protein
MWSLHPRDSSARINSWNAIFSQWGHLKTKIYQTNPHVYEEIRNISNPDMSTYPKNYCVLAMFIISCNLSVGKQSSLYEAAAVLFLLQLTS